MQGFDQKRPSLIDGIRAAPDRFPSLHSLLTALLALWPDHGKFLSRSFRDRSDALLESTGLVASMIVKLAGTDLAKLCEDYRWMCDRLQEEELEFRRTGRYRRRTFAEADRDVYANPEYMSRYINGILLSQALWFNHAAVLDLYIRRFLPETPPGGRLLEVGPGHGLMLCMAANQGRLATLTAWDVSETSISRTAQSLERLKISQPVELAIGNVVEKTSGNRRFDVVTMSEVLEHLESPASALANVRTLLAPGGRLFISVPVNSPAPDHLYLLRSPEEAVELIQHCGFNVTDARFFAMGGYTLERARRADVTISCAIIAELP